MTTGGKINFFSTVAADITYYIFCTGMSGIRCFFFVKESLIKPLLTVINFHIFFKNLFVFLCCFMSKIKNVFISVIIVTIT